MGKHYKGRHLRVFRGVYWHHGVGLGRGKVAHFQGEAGRPKSESRVVISTLAEFQATSPTIERVDTPTTSSRDEIVERTLAAVGSKGLEESYSVLTNNCEHFATYCCTGQHPPSTEGQVGEGVVALFGGNLALGILYAVSKGAGWLMRNDPTSAVDELQELAEAETGLSEMIRSSPAYAQLASRSRRGTAKSARLNTTTGLALPS